MSRLDTIPADAAAVRERDSHRQNIKLRTLLSIGGWNMKTYVAEINGEAIVAFRATGDDDANAIVNDENGELQQVLNGFSQLFRADGSPLWDGQSEIKTRLATEAEDESWHEARNAGALNAGNVYLVPVKSIGEGKGATAA
jgi:hypothetical protein